jgi:D-serine deaminase-like pyridoxal phosphate-dependent protein
VTQASIGSCSLENNASFVLARVISKYANPKRLMLDAGALALSKDQGATHMRPAGAPQTWGQIQGHPEMHLTRITQELGVVEGDFDFEGSLSVNSFVKIMPNHSCLAAACYPKFYVVDSDCETVIDEWKTCPRDW